MLKAKRPRALFGRRVLLLCGTLVLLLALFAGVRTPSASAESWSYVRIFHASPDAGTVDVFMDGSKILSNFQYGTLTGYTPVVAGMHKLQIAVIGTGTNAAILTQTLSLQPGTPYTAVALGSQAAGFSLHIFADDNQVNGNLAKVRIYHLSPGAGMVDVSTKGNMLINGLPYAQASNYVSVAPGTYTFNVLSTQNGTSTAISTQLKPWTITSIFAISPIKNGSSGGTLQFIQAQITGMPGMPGTGSDPHALPTPAPASSPTPWLLVLPILALLATSTGIGVAFRRTIAREYRLNKGR